MKKKKNEKIDINTIMAMFVVYTQQQIEYTEMKMKAMKEWQSDDCECTECEQLSVAVPEEAESTFGEDFSKEWL
jgi:hypothetical protein